MSENGDNLADIADDVLESAYANGTHYDARWLRDHAVKASSGQNPLKMIVVDLILGDSIERLDSSKDRRIYGPASVLVEYWPDGGINQRTYQLGKGPEMPRTTYDGRYIKPGVQLGRKPGTPTDTDTFEWDDVSHTVREWMDDTRRHPSVTEVLLRRRLKVNGWTVERALTEPKRHRSA
ncbi:hypothetical protein [Streptomyces tubercidicus]|uniref:hypothetical protein n=1 Tax=Streptomyces tubercidicus TaxID=47759 RepID=UPI0036A1E590